MKRRLVLLTEIISPYRIPVFNELARREDIELHVIFLAETDSTQRQWLVYKDEIQFSYEVLPSWRRRIGRHNFLFNWGLGRALRRTNPDVIVCGGYNYLASWRALGWARRHQVPFSAWIESTARDFRHRHNLVESIKTVFMKGCDTFIVPGKSSMDYIQAFGVNTDRIFIAPNAVDNAFFMKSVEDIRENAESYRQKLGLPARFFLFAGRLIPGKGVFELLQAYGMLPCELQDSIGLIFVGDGPAKAELESLSNNIASGIVQFAGFAHREKLVSYYALAEMLVFPTYSDTWGMVVNEAMACGLPIVCSVAAGCAEDLIENGKNGIIVPVRDVRELMLAMENLANNPETRLKMGQNNAEQICKNSPQACAAGIALAANVCKECLYE